MVLHNFFIRRGSDKGNKQYKYQKQRYPRIQTDREKLLHRYTAGFRP